jgi:hypothetical protein
MGLQKEIDDFHASVKARAVLIAIEWAGSVSLLAKRLGYTRYAVNKFVLRKHIPITAALALEQIEGFPLTASEMCPGIDTKKFKTRHRCPRCSANVHVVDKRLGYSPSFNALFMRIQSKSKLEAKAAAAKSKQTSILDRVV